MVVVYKIINAAPKDTMQQHHTAKITPCTAQVAVHTSDKTLPAKLRATWDTILAAEQWRNWLPFQKEEKSKPIKDKIWNKRIRGKEKKP